MIGGRWPFLALGILSLLTVIGYSPVPAQAPRYKGDFLSYQKELASYLADKDNLQRKGWKTLKRWEDFEARRMNPDGSTADPRAYAQTLHEVASWKGAAASNKQQGGGGWTPYGPNDYATPFMNYGWIPGMGRINCIAFHPTIANTFWVGVAQGGVWKTVDGGSTWTPLTDDLPMLRISDIAVNPQNPDEIYLSVGDYAYLGAGLSLDDRKRHTHYGLGVYKTTDGGNTWSPTGLSLQQTSYDFSLTRRVVIHPSTPATLVAAGTHGVWRSTDAGTNWTQINATFMWDIERDPINANTLYASSGYRATLNYGSAGIWKSTDFGLTWTQQSLGVAPQGQVQRIELAISPSNPSYVYALCANMEAGLEGVYRTTDGGSNWTLRSSFPNILEWGDGSGTGGQGWYDLAIIVDPTNPDKVYTGGINMWGTSDGGTTWDGVSYWLSDYGPSIHADQHQLAYNPLNGKFYICNDGGLYSTSNIQIGSWTDAMGVPGYQWPTIWTPLSSGMQITSFYRCGVSEANPGNVIAGAQDNATYFYNGTDWKNLFGGDGMDCFLHPTDPDLVYGSSQYGNLSYSWDGGLSSSYISPGWETGEWVTPWMLDPSNPNRILAAFGNVFETTDQGMSWNLLSSFPVNPTSGQPNVASALGIAPSNSDYMYVSKRYFNSLGEPSAFWATSDRGLSWTQRNPGGVPDSLYHTMIAVDDNDPQTVYLSLGGFVSGLKVMKTTDAGQTWSNISGNLPNLPVNCIVHHTNSPHNTIYVGMDVGVYYRNDTMANWALYMQDLPNVIVSDLAIHRASGKIYAATFGRGIWVADAVDQVGSSIQDEQHLYSMQVAPNPSSGAHELIFEGMQGRTLTIELVDIMGRVLSTEQVNVPAASFRRPQSRALSAGMYFYRVKGEGISLSQRFLIRQ